MMIGPATLLKTSGEAISSDVDGEIVLISVASGRYFGLDPVSSEIWRRLEEPTSFEALRAGLQAHFEGEPETIEREALVFVTGLVDRGLVEVLN